MRGFTIIETALAGAITLMGALLVTEAIQSSDGAVQANIAKTQAVARGDTLLRQMALEISQTTTKVDPSLPPGEDQRLWILPNGIQFQRVAGYDIEPDGLVTQTWTPRISYLWNAALGIITRAEVGGVSRVVARGVSDFSVTTNATGQVVVSIETRAGSASRGEEAAHQRVIRITPRNALK